MSPAPGSAPSDFRGLGEWTGADHAALIGRTVGNAIESKYLRGQREHGGNISLKAGMLGHAEDESRDLSVYLFVLREQLGEVRAQAQALVMALDKVLGTPEQ